MNLNQKHVILFLLQLQKGYYYGGYLKNYTPGTHFIVSVRIEDILFPEGTETVMNTCPFTVLFLNLQTLKFKGKA